MSSDKMGVLEELPRKSCSPRLVMCRKALQVWPHTLLKNSVRLVPRRAAACTDAWLEESLPRKLKGLNHRLSFLPCFVSELCGIPGAAWESTGILVLRWGRVPFLFAEAKRSVASSDSRLGVGLSFHMLLVLNLQEKTLLLLAVRGPMCSPTC